MVILYGSSFSQRPQIRRSPNHERTATSAPALGADTNAPFPGYYRFSSTQAPKSSSRPPLFCAKGGGNTFLRNVGKHLPDYIASHHNTVTPPFHCFFCISTFSFSICSFFIYLLIVSHFRYYILYLLPRVVLPFLSYLLPFSKPLSVRTTC
jgi:hypothetical protein